jgi:hypothetical protein
MSTLQVPVMHRKISWLKGSQLVNAASMNKQQDSATPQQNCFRQ